jgi:hypothetical protein
MDMGRQSIESQALGTTVISAGRAGHKIIRIAKDIEREVEKDENMFKGTHGNCHRIDGRNTGSEL